MAPARWYVTEHAVDRYVFARRWPRDDAHWQRAEAELLELSAHASYRERHGAIEVWRSPKRTGGGLRWVIDTRPHPGGPLARVVWVGYSAPPSRYYTEQH
jgi:hypothetical protein